MSNEGKLVDLVKYRQSQQALLNPKTDDLVVSADPTAIISSQIKPLEVEKITLAAQPVPEGVEHIKVVILGPDVEAAKSAVAAFRESKNEVIGEIIRRSIEARADLPERQTPEKVARSVEDFKGEMFSRGVIHTPEEWEILLKEEGRYFDLPDMDGGMWVEVISDKGKVQSAKSDYSLPQLQSMSLAPVEKIYLRATEIHYQKELPSNVASLPTNDGFMSLDQAIQTIQEKKAA